MSACLNWIFTSCNRAFSWATWSASGEISKACMSAFGRALAKAMAMQPLPVPMSKRRGEESVGQSFKTRSTNSAVSGRGIKTAGVTRRVNPWKRASPNRYWMGCCCRSPSTISSIFVRSFADKSLSLPTKSWQVVRPQTLSIMIRMSACSSPAG